MTSLFEKELRHAVEFIPDRLYYVALSTQPPPQSNRHFFTIDNDMVYWNFYLDFGPLNLGHLYRYCVLLNNKLNDNKLKDKTIYFFSHTHAHKRANAAYLICSWYLLYGNKTPEEAFRPFKNYPAPFPPWHDATPSMCTFNLTILHTLQGLHKAREHRFFDFSRFNIEEYEHYEQVENGDLNWYVEGKFCAFAGPHAERSCSAGGYYTLRPEDYVPYFKRKNMSLVVRLNKSYYDARKFTTHGIDHLDLYFLDGSNPPEHILQKFIQRSEETPGAIAVHCKAGLGRTGTCIAAYIMKHYKLTAEEIIGWMRITRPGSVIGPQQNFLKEIQNRMWREGDLMRARLTNNMSPNSLTLPHVNSISSTSSKEDNTTTASNGTNGNNNNGSNGVGNGNTRSSSTGRPMSSTNNNLLMTPTKQSSTNNNNNSMNSPGNSPTSQLTSRLSRTNLMGNTSNNNLMNTSNSNIKQSTAISASTSSGKYFEPITSNTNTTTTNRTTRSNSNTGTTPVNYLNSNNSSNNSLQSINSPVGGGSNGMNANNFTTATNSSKLPRSNSNTNMNNLTSPTVSNTSPGGPLSQYLRASSSKMTTTTSSGGYRPSSAEAHVILNSTTKDEDEGKSQGDMLRLRRQHQTNQHHSLPVSTSNNNSNATTPLNSPSRKSYEITTPGSNSNLNTSGNNNMTASSPSGTPVTSRPRKSSFGFLSSWKS